MQHEQRIVDTWNNLLNEVVEAGSIETFERRIDKHWKHLDLKFKSKTTTIKQSAKETNEEPII